MNRLSKILITSTAVFALFACAASAATHTFTITLDHAQAGTVGIASGSGTASYDDVTGEFSWYYTYADLSGMPTSAHFHGPAAAGASAGIRVDVEALGSGAMYTDNPNEGMVTISGANGEELIDGLWYLNIHTAMETGGEIRGQLVNDNPPVDNTALKTSLEKKIKKLKKKLKKASGPKAKRLKKKLKKLKKRLKVLA